MKKCELARFVVDITPPVEHMITYGVNEKVDSRIYIRGVVVDDSRTRVVIASADILYFAFSAYEKMVAVIAEAAETSPGNVFLTAVHQHDSVLMKFPGEDGSWSRQIIAPEYWEKCVCDISDKVKNAVSDGFEKIEHIATATTKIQGLASNRRTYNDDGSIAMRYSMCRSPEIRNRPEGVYDPHLRTIAFLDGRDNLLAALHYYASHPMAAYHRNMVSADVPGVALKRVAEQLGEDDRNIYITGCGGNVTFGKYGFWDEDASAESKVRSMNHFGEILGKAIIENINNLERRSCGSLRIRSEKLELPLREGVTSEYLRNIIDDGNDHVEKELAIRWKKIIDNWDKYGVREVRTLSFGDEVTILELFSEMAVEYQLYAHSLVKDRFLAVSAYNEASCSYVCTAKMYEEGGYEPTKNYLSSEIEERLKAVIKKLLS